MRFSFLHFYLIISTLSLFGQTQINVMAYNIMHYPTTLHYDSELGTFVDRAPVLMEIVDDYRPDILMLCEIKEDEAADYIFQESLLPINPAYRKVEFVLNQSSSYTELQQMLYFNSQKLSLTGQQIITTYIRDINQYSFTINTATPLHLEVFVAHLKASSGSVNENKRLQMVEEFTAHLGSIPDDSYVIFGGDFNFYAASEPGYQELLDPTNTIRLIDPISRPGDWHNNAYFTDVHTQSPLQSNGHFQTVSGGSDGVTGGLDDRFDFILMSENLEDGTALSYIPDTYKSYGNNSNCFNGSINDPNCDGAFSQEIRDLLYHMSDHLPVVMSLESAETVIDIPNLNLEANHLTIIGSNVVTAQLHFRVSEKMVGNEVSLYNAMGQKIITQQILTKNTHINTENLNSGVYYLSSQHFSLHSPLKFIKK